MKKDIKQKILNTIGIVGIILGIIAILLILYKIIQGF